MEDPYCSIETDLTSMMDTEMQEIIKDEKEKLNVSTIYKLPFHKLNCCHVISLF